MVGPGALIVLLLLLLHLLHRPHLPHRTVRLDFEDPSAFERPCEIPDRSRAFSNNFPTQQTLNTTSHSTHSISFHRIKQATPAPTFIIARKTVLLHYMTVAQQLKHALHCCLVMLCRLYPWTSNKHANMDPKMVSKLCPSLSSPSAPYQRNQEQEGEGRGTERWPKVHKERIKRVRVISNQCEE